MKPNKPAVLGTPANVKGTSHAKELVKVVERPTERERLQGCVRPFDEDRSGAIEPVEIDKIPKELALKGRNTIVFEIM